MGVRGGSGEAVQSNAEREALRVELFTMLEPLLFRYKDLFYEIDEDRGGTVSCDELLGAFKRKRVAAPTEKVRQLFQLVDVNGDGQVEISEFMEEMRRIKLAQRSTLSGAERSRHLRRASSKRERRRRQLNAEATVAAKDRVGKAPQQDCERTYSKADEEARSNKLHRQQAAARRAFEQRRADQLRWRRSAQSTMVRARGRYIDVDPRLRGIQTPDTWSSNLIEFAEGHRETPTSPQQEVYSLLARDQPTCQAAEIWEKSICLGGVHLDQQSALEVEPEPEPEPDLRGDVRQSNPSSIGSTPRRARHRHRPASAPTNSFAGGDRRVAITTDMSTAAKSSEAHRLEHDHAEVLIERGAWYHENYENVHPGVQFDTGGRTVWIGQLPHTCIQAPKLLHESLEQTFGTVASLCVREKSWGLATFQHAESAKAATKARTIDVPGTWPGI